jgi:CubicO group peptidase (beta-lactamase class C family)
MMYRHGIRAKRNQVILSAMLLGALLATACRPVTAPPAASAPELDAATSAKVDGLVEAQMKELGVPGVAVGIVKDGSLVYAKGFGVTKRNGGAPVTPSTIFQLSSIAKTFTSTAILQLVEQGKVDLDAPVTKYLPYFALADGREGEITVRHLLTHTSGLPDTSWTDMSPYLEARDDEMALEDQVRSARKVSLLFDPGTQFEYTSFGYDVLGDIVAKVSGQPFEEYVTEQMFVPLGMNHSTLLLSDVDPKALAMPHVPGGDGQVVTSDIFPYTRSFAPDSTLYSNVEDMAAYAITTMRHGAAGQPAVLAPESYDAAWTSYSQAPFPPPETNYGFGWQIGEHAGEQVVGHSGIDIGYNSFLAMLPAQSAAVIVMTNFNDLEEFVMPAFLMRTGLLDIVLQAFTQK